MYTSIVGADKKTVASMNNCSIFLFFLSFFNFYFAVPGLFLEKICTIVKAAELIRT